jgi:hypothetical protein
MLYRAASLHSQRVATLRRHELAVGILESLGKWESASITRWWNWILLPRPAKPSGDFGTGLFTTWLDGTGTGGYPCRDQPGVGPGQVVEGVYAINNTAGITIGTYDGGSGISDANYLSQGGTILTARRSQAMSLTPTRIP